MKTIARATRRDLRELLDRPRDVRAGGDLRRAHGVAPRAGEAECIICGCSDLAACPEGCAWIAVDRDKGVGICSTETCVRLARRRLTRPPIRGRA